LAESPETLRDPFSALRRATPARIGLGRAGQGLPTAPMLALQLAHARARDAVHASLDVSRIAASVGRPSLVVESAAPDRTAYLQNPDLGRRLGARTTLPPHGDYDLAIVIADGLSATAAHAHASPVVSALASRLSGWRIAPVVIARQARVAIGDEIGAALGARLVVVLIGERPGLSAVDGLSAYLTWDPKPGRRDNERNCVSNIRDPGGLHPEQAAEKIVWLLTEARRMGLTGVALKDRQPTHALRAPPPGESLPPPDASDPQV
jgi:ethanolamine ammonia-lyase small subunit